MNKIKQTVFSFPKGSLITVESVYNRLNRKTTKDLIRTTLSRMSKKDEVRRKSQGAYYIPQVGIIEEKPFLDAKLIEQKYIKNDGNVYGIYTGQRLLNKWGLSQQVAINNEILSNKTESRMYVINDTLTLRKSKIEITKSNFRIVELIEVLRIYKSAYSEMSKESRLLQISKIVNGFSKTEKVEINYFLREYSSKKVFTEFKNLLPYLDEITQKISSYYLGEDMNELA